MPVTAHATVPSRRGLTAHAGTAAPRVSGYEIVRLIGRGGMASVYLARQLKLDRLVALKELDPSLAGDPAFAERFLRESRMAGSLAHPNIVTVYDYFEDGGLPYIAMEHLDHGSLRPYVRGRSLAQIAGVLESVLAGLAHAHATGVVHCDLKPENILVTAAGRVKLADFGIARAVGDAASVNLSPTGTLAYMAPERAGGMGVTAAVDLWSAGVVAQELIAGAEGRVNAALEPWAQRLLAGEPANRPTAAMALEELEELAIAAAGPRWRRSAPLSLESSEPAGPTAPVGRRRRAVLAGTALVAAGAAAAAIASPDAEHAQGSAGLEPRDASLVAFPAEREPPVRLAGPREVRVTSTGGAERVDFHVTARRGKRSLHVRCAPMPGSLFAIGATEVRCSAAGKRRSLRVVVVPRTTPQTELDPPSTPAPRAPAPASTPGSRAPEPTQGIATS